MKKIYLLLFLLAIIANTSDAQVLNCSAICVLNIDIDTASNKLLVTIYNGDTNYVNYPTVQVVDIGGDTVGNINGEFDLFGQSPGETVVHVIPTTLESLPEPFNVNVILTDQVWDISCLLSYPTNCTVTGFPVISLNAAISVYPNPADDEIYIQADDLKNEPGEVMLYGFTGYRVNTYTLNNDHLMINTKSLNPGLYFIRVHLGNEFTTTKVVISH